VFKPHEEGSTSDSSPVGVARGCNDGRVAKRFLQVPELVVGFDTETTGLDATIERAISYGFCAYRYGKPEWSEQFFVVPDRPISAGAKRVHGISLEDIQRKGLNEPIFTVETGLERAMAILRGYQDQNAYFVGSNLLRFDVEMLFHSYTSIFSKTPESDGLNLSKLRIIDVVDHDLLIEPSRAVRPRRGLDNLCGHYGVKSGGHDALSDARAAVEVFFEQVLFNTSGQMALDLTALPTQPSDVHQTHDS
jgi:DNA polymerase III epsilon subunit-like protein